MPRPLHAALCALTVALAVAHPCSAQSDDKKPRKEPWEAFADAPEVKGYLEQLKTGAVDAAGRAALVTKVLPLLEEPANRRSIERLRRRIREGLLSERVADAATLEAVNREAATWALSRVKAKDIDPVVAVNEMLLVGDLRGKDGKPWPGAVPLLAASAADQAVPTAARAAALAGLARHAEAGMPLTSAAATILKVAVAPPAAGTGDAGDWLSSRALGLLPMAMPEASPEAAGELSKLIEDASRPVDVRVRAAEALGRMATAAAKIDATKTLEAIRAAAIRGLQQDLESAKEEEFGRSLSAGGLATAGFGGGEFGSPPGAPGGFGMRPDAGGFAAQPPGPSEPAPPVEPTVLERDAWRLAALANAIQPIGKGTGITGVAGDAAEAAKVFAAKLRENASFLHEWIHPPKDDEPKRPGGPGRQPAAGGEFGFPGAGDAGADAKPTKQELGQALRDALADLQASPPFAAAPAGVPPSQPEPKATPGNDPFGSP
jgi:hypothetical protein